MTPGVQTNFVPNYTGPVDPREAYIVNFDDDEEVMNARRPARRVRTGRPGVRKGPPFDTGGRA
jgi:hypothetical protein